MKKRMASLTAFLLASAMMLSACSEQPAEDTVSADATSAETTTAERVQTEQTEQSEQTEVVSETTAAETENDVIPEPSSIVFSNPSGFYEAEFDVTITSAEEGEIFYTLDGSNPAISDTAIAYAEPLKITSAEGRENVVSAVDPLLISGNFNKVNSSRDGFEWDMKLPTNEDVDKCTVIRAAVKKTDGTFGTDSAATYFIGSPEEHIRGIAESCEAAGTSLAVMSINVNYDDFFSSDKGIYVKGDIFDKALEKHLAEGNRLRDTEDARAMDANYKQRGREWERNASVTMLEVTPDGAETVINQNCGIRVQGNYSRSDLQKGLRLYARKEYGENNFNYAVFGEDYLNDSGEVMDKFKHLVLRAGGNCAFTSKFNDAYWQSLVTETACETKESRPCVVYLNGEYWGLYVLEEDYNDDYFEDLHGVNKDDVVVYKGDAEAYKRGYTLDEGTIPEGEKESYYFKELNSFFKSHSDLKSQEDYDEFVKLVDPESVMDYFAVQCWINNKWDWPGKNWSMWKTINVDENNPYADGRWRFMFYDVEFGGVSGGGDVRTNTIKEDNYKPKGLLDMDTNNPAVLCFAYLMTNEGFRTEFYERLTGLSDGYFEQTLAEQRLVEFVDIYSPLYEQFFERYPETGDYEKALTDGYASAQCILDFVGGRRNHIQPMIDFCEKVLN
ncbi:MAG: CotH kinase family protein [Oscillospiraceae bacterium]|nr:CotH kinase family protein [Oscillospiraceae bacterium]